MMLSVARARRQRFRTHTFIHSVDLASYLVAVLYSNLFGESNYCMSAVVQCARAADGNCQRYNYALYVICTHQHKNRNILSFIRGKTLWWLAYVGTYDDFGDNCFKSFHIFFLLVVRKRNSLSCARRGKIFLKATSHYDQLVPIFSSSLSSTVF